MKALLLFSYLFFSSIPKAESVDCHGLWANGFPQRGSERSAGICHRFHPALSSARTSIELYMQNEAVDDLSVKERMEWAYAAVAYASDKFTLFASVLKYDLISELEEMP